MALKWIGGSDFAHFLDLASYHLDYLDNTFPAELLQLGYQTEVAAVCIGCFAGQYRRFFV